MEMDINNYISFKIKRHKKIKNTRVGERAVLRNVYINLNKLI